MHCHLFLSLLKPFSIPCSPAFPCLFLWWIFINRYRSFCSIFPSCAITGIRWRYHIVPSTMPQWHWIYSQGTHCYLPEMSIVIYRSRFIARHEILHRPSMGDRVVRLTGIEGATGIWHCVCYQLGKLHYYTNCSPLGMPQLGLSQTLRLTYVVHTVMLFIYSLQLMFVVSCSQWCCCWWWW